MITLTTEQAQQIEKALKLAIRTSYSEHNNIKFEASLDTIRAARAREQAEQKPVAWMCWIDSDEEMNPAKAQLTSYEPKAYTKRMPLYAAPVRTKDLTDAENRLKRIAMISHCGGLANMSEDDALTAIRKITLPYFDREASNEEARAVIAADREKNK